jgi:hypothetical protein
MNYFGKPREFNIAEVSISWKRRAHDSAYIMGGGDSHGADDIVDVHQGAGTLDDDPVAMYLSNYNI